MISRHPMISVVMPVYNAERYLAEALESILTQTFGDFELIALDDGSTDRSGAILLEHATRDPRIRLIQQENSGIITTLNRGLQLARGELIARMDADDVALPERFAAQVDHLNKHPELVALGTGVYLIDSDGRPLMPMKFPIDQDGINESFDKLETPICHPSVMMRRQAVLNIGGYDKKYIAAEDMDLFLRLSEAGQISNLGSIHLHYRQHLSSVGYSKRKLQREMIYAAVSAAHERQGRKTSKCAIEINTRPVSKAEVLRKWGWWALQGGNVATARHYARHAVMMAPFSRESWRLALTSARGY